MVVILANLAILAVLSKSPNYEKALSNSRGFKINENCAWFFERNAGVASLKECIQTIFYQKHEM